jgi:hypothetical protein
MTKSQYTQNGISLYTLLHYITLLLLLLLINNIINFLLIFFNLMILVKFLSEFVIN